MTRYDDKSYNFLEVISIIWFTIDAFTHLTIELGYVILALTTTAEKTDNYLGHIWREYGRADSRWAVRDPNVISIEIATVLMGVLCFVELYGVMYRSSWRHVLVVIICVAELYGGWMTFAPEWIEGSPNLDGSSFELFWIYLVFMNGLWVLVPLILLWDSCSRISNACQGVELINAGFPRGGPSKVYFNLIAAVIGAYMVLVPLVLLQAQGVPVKE